MLCKDRISQLDKETNERYSKRFRTYGVNAKTLGWGCEEDQFARFASAVRYVNFNEKSVMDIGCGFSDFYKFLIKANINIKEYRGVDINYELIEAAKELYPQNKYDCRNILLNNYGEEQTDVVCLFGLLNFTLSAGLDNLVYSKEMITAAWKITKDILVADFLSNNLTKSYPRERFVYYHDPKDVLDICFNLCDNVLLVHNYRPIPQKEFMVILQKGFNNENN